MTDPRIGDLLKTVNGRLMDRAIAHAIELFRLQTGEALRIADFLDRKVMPAILDRIATDLVRITSRGQLRIQAISRSEGFKRLQADVATIVRDKYDEIKKDLVEKLKDTAAMESAFQTGAIVNALGVSLTVNRPNIPLIRSLVTGTPIRGRFVGRWMRDLGNDATKRIGDSVTIGLTQGETIREISQRVRSINSRLKLNATAFVRTSINHVATVAREQVFKENRHLISAVLYVATLDNRTTLICINLDGRKFPIGEGPRPPQHIQCRSVTTPIIKKAKEFGLDKIPEAKRASLDGAIPAKINYVQWLKTKPASFQKEVLGTARFKLFKQGVPIRRFTDSRNRVLTLDQLRSRLSKEGIIG